jgi:hypothetical protein
VTTDDLLFKVVRSNGTDEVLARAVNLLIARGGYARRRTPITDAILIWHFHRR